MRVYKNLKGKERKCPGCGLNFNTSSSRCPTCHNKYQKKYYKSHPHSILKSFKRRKTEIRKLIIQSKLRPCLDCGHEYPYYVMDFDHVRGIKKFNLSIAAQKLYVLETVRKEIAKCDIICANCHRLRTWKRISEKNTEESNKKPYQQKWT